MTTQYYAPQENIQGGYVILPAEEAHHAARVLRKRPGDEIIVVDGEGGWYRVELDQVDKRHASGRIVETKRDVGEPATPVVIGLALLKHQNRFEVFLEKAVELGVTGIVPLVTKRTEQGRFKMNRAHNILVAALKQCGRSRLPHLYGPKEIDEWPAEVPADSLRLIAHEQASPDQDLRRILTDAQFESSVHMLIGPEGGFTDSEIEQAESAGWQVVSLGPRRLRAETAALFALSSIRLFRN